MQGLAHHESDATSITIENGSCGMIDFDIVSPGEKRVIFACRFVRGTEIGVVSTDSGTNMNIIKEHGLLGHDNKD